MTFDDLKFKAEDFEDCTRYYTIQEQVANKVNRILEEKLASILQAAPEVFDHSNGHGRRWHTKELKPPQFLTKKARLVCIKPIKE